MKKVLIPTRLDRIARDFLEKTGHYTVVQDDASELGLLASQHPDTYALIVRSEKVTAELIDALPALKVIIRAGAGYNTIDIKHARRKGVDVMNTPGANSNAVAEEVIALILADARHLIAADASARAGQWEKKAFMGRELAGKTVGIVGLGNIGQLVARRLAGFNCRLLGYDPVISNERAQDVDVRLCDLKTLFTESDYVSLHIPENEKTRGMINAELIGLLKPGATIVNCARAGILDENALRAAKGPKKLRFLNDVYPKDEPGPKSVADIADIMAPHLGASTHEANFNAARRAAEQLVDLDYKGVTSFIVNRDIPEGLDETYCDLAFTIARVARTLVGQDKALKLIETSVYGDLQPFADWLVVPIVSGIWDGFERSVDSAEARRFLDEMGIECAVRKVDPAKGYGNSITVDLTCELDPGNLRRVSIRGTLAEGLIVISRIDGFSKLYIEPAGQMLFFIYDDRPGVVGAIGNKLAGAGINIEDMRHSHDFKTNRSLAILKVNRAVPADVLEAIKCEIKPSTAVSVEL